MCWQIPQLTPKLTVHCCTRKKLIVGAADCRNHKLVGATVRACYWKQKCNRQSFLHTWIFLCDSYFSLLWLCLFKYVFYSSCCTLVSFNIVTVTSQKRIIRTQNLEFVMVGKPQAPIIWYNASENCTVHNILDTIHFTFVMIWISLWKIIRLV